VREDLHRQAGGAANRLSQDSRWRAYDGGGTWGGEPHASPEKARVHHATWRRSGNAAARGTRAAACDAGDRSGLVIAWAKAVEIGYYPRMIDALARIIGSDIAHAVPLTLIAGVGHWIIGTVDRHIIGSLLAGSLPGIILGSYLTVRVPEPALRVLLAATLILVAGKLAYDHIESSSSLLTAFTRSAPH
jgi:Sulfite exporter TauE/SafE